MNDDIEYRSFWDLPPGRNETDPLFEWKDGKLCVNWSQWRLPFGAFEGLISEEPAGTLKYIQE